MSAFGRDFPDVEKKHLHGVLREARSFLRSLDTAGDADVDQNGIKKFVLRIAIEIVKLNDCFQEYFDVLYFALNKYFAAKGITISLPISQRKQISRSNSVCSAVDFTHLLCPVSHKLMTVPVIGSTGKTIDYFSWEGLAETKRQEYSSSSPIYNISVSRLINDWKCETNRRSLLKEDLLQILISLIKSGQTSTLLHAVDAVIKDLQPLMVGDNLSFAPYINCGQKNGSMKNPMIDLQGDGQSFEMGWPENSDNFDNHVENLLLKCVRNHYFNFRRQKISPSCMYARVMFVWKQYGEGVIADWVVTTLLKLCTEQSSKAAIYLFSKDNKSTIIQLLTEIEVMENISNRVAVLKAFFNLIDGGDEIIMSICRFNVRLLNLLSLEFTRAEEPGFSLTLGILKVLKFKSGHFSEEHRPTLEQILVCTLQRLEVEVLKAYWSDFFFIVGNFCEDLQFINFFKPQFFGVLNDSVQFKDLFRINGCCHILKMIWKDQSIIQWLNSEDAVALKSMRSIKLLLDDKFLNEVPSDLIGFRRVRLVG